MILVELYSKQDCSLCVQAKEAIERMQQEFPMTFHEIKLVTGEEMFDKYENKVPVVHINKVEVFKYRVNEHQLRIHLERIVDEDNSRDAEGSEGSS